MDHRALLADFARRPLDTARRVLAGLSPDVLHAMPVSRGNSIAWLLWHAARQQDAQLAALRGGEQVWASGWGERVGVARGTADFGFGDGPADVASLRVADPDALLGYVAAVVDATVAYVDGLSESDLDVVVDTSWTPHVTRGVRLVSIIDDAAVHVGQAAYARGLLEAWSIGY